jgi:hypothetical protein
MPKEGLILYFPFIHDGAWLNILLNHLTNWEPPVLALKS